MIVGYKLVDGSGNVYQSWGGVWGECPGVPNPLFLPDGAIVNAPMINMDYDGYLLIPWEINEPLPPVPESITRRQCALELLAQNLILNTEALAMAKTAEIPPVVSAVFDKAVADKTMTQDQRLLAEIDFAATNYYRSNSLLSMMGLTEDQIDQFFISASTR